MANSYELCYRTEVGIRKMPRNTPDAFVFYEHPDRRKQTEIST